MRTKIFLYVIVLALGVGACQTNSSTVGKGPMVLSLRIQAGFEKYKTEGDPSYFAVAKDGKGFGYTHCPPDYSSCLDDGGDKALRLCNQKAKIRGSECLVFAAGRKVIWDGKITYTGVKADYLLSFAKTSGGTSNNYQGTGRLIDNGRMIDLKFKNSPCRGEFILETKKWFLRGCKNNYSAAGTFVTGTGTEKYYGIGEDNKGGSVDIKLLVPKMSAPKNTVTTASTSPDLGGPFSVKKTEELLRDSLYVADKGISGKDTIKTVRVVDNSVFAEIERESDYDHFNTKGVKSITKRMYRDICNRDELASYLQKHNVPFEIKIFNQYKDLMITLDVDLNRCGDYGVVTTASTEKIQAGPTSKKPPPAIGEKDTFSLSFQWEGVQDLLAGTIHYPKKRDGTFVAHLSGEGFDCSGSYTFGDDRTIGVWNIACENKKAASGTFKMNDNGSSGIGTDSKGRKVKYTVNRR